MHCSGSSSRQRPNNAARSSRAPSSANVVSRPRRERMNRTVKDATTKMVHYETTQALCAHVLAFVAAYNFAKRSAR